MSKFRTYLKYTVKHPLGALYGTLLGLVAFSAALPMFTSGMIDAALVDLTMAAMLIALMMKNYFSNCRCKPSGKEKCTAWLILLLADILALLLAHNFAGDITTALAFSLLICAMVLFFSGTAVAAVSTIPALWCCVFMPYHEEIMLLLSFPLRLNATVLSAAILNLSGIKIVHSGTSLLLPGLDIAITDACSGIRQLDAFILIVFIAVQMLHRKTGWKILHFSFVVPSIILGNSLRIVLTVWLYRFLGETVFENTWHTVLGYGQIIIAIVIFLAVGKIFSLADSKTEEEKQ